MQKITSRLSFVVVFFAGVIVGILVPFPQRSTQPPWQEPPSSRGMVVNSSPTAQVQTPLPNPVAETVIKRVIDGDTVELSDGRKVRYIGIDAPEMSKHDCFAVEAKAANERLVLNRSVRLERDVSDTDRFGRLLRYVYVGDTLVNLQLVADGFAQVLTYPPDVRYNEKLRAATAEARQAKRGLWGGCPATANTSPTRLEPPPASCAIKGNINAKGEKIYHLPGCGSYEKTVIEETKGEQWFCTEAEAQTAGFRKAGNCP